MKRLMLLVGSLILVIALPVWAQSSLDPAAFVPASISQYYEVQTDEDGLNTFRSFYEHYLRLAQIDAPEGDLVDMAILGTMPGLRNAGIESVDDIVGWTGGRVGVVAFNVADPEMFPNPVMALVLPVSDADGAQAFVERLTAEAGEAETVNGMTITELNEAFTLGVTDEVIWLGVRPAIEAAIDGLTDGTLADAGWYQQVKSQLPAALITGYASPDWARAEVAMEESFSSPSNPSAATLLQAALMLHPAESEMEDAFMDLPPFTGAGFAVNYVDGRMDITGTALVDATYAAPTLTTETAGAGLLDLVPADSYVVYDMYDSVTLTAAVGGLAFMGPAIGNVFDNIVASLENPYAPTPTPTPTPTPMPPPTASELVAQAQPVLRQIEAMLGMPVDELYGLVNGEFAVAVFPTSSTPPSANMPLPVGGALWLQTDDPERVLETVENAMLLLGLGSAVDTETVGGVEVHTVSIPNTPDRPVYGILGDDVVFVTIESSLQAVLNAASDDVSIANTRAFPNDLYTGFGSDQEAFLYADLTKTVNVTNSQNPWTEPQQLGRLIGSADFAADGVFLLHLSWILPE